MILVKSILHLQQALEKYRQKGLTIGFVPTMGALHPGHLSLINLSKSQCDITVCSIFVNPTQFNNQHDFEKYPITIEKDIELLTSAGCNILFLPTVNEMYPENETVIHYHLGYIETILEGKYRPGHFQGVCQIVDKLLKAVNPTTLFLGQKDYQQCMVIAEMMRIRNHKATLIIGNTVREADGLAMSSRNMRLSITERQQALTIIQALNSIKQQLLPGSVSSICNSAITSLEENGFKVDYVEIANANNLETITHWDGKTPLVALAAAFINEVRLIDNLILYP